MTQITTRAKQHLLNRLPNEDDTRVFRLVPTTGGRFALHLDTSERRDVVVTHEGSVVLSMRPSVARQIEGWVLDVNGSDDGARELVLRPIE
jgi:hypothetical protein